MLDLDHARTVFANGLRHHVLVRGEGEDVVLLLHGFLDSAYGFEEVSRRLALRGFRVVAPDFRGHGRSEWAAPSAYYHFPDYLLDVEGLLDALEVSRCHVVGHSMGGTVATLFAGVRPRRVRRLVTMEGIGPPESPLSDTAARYGRWMDGVAKVRARVGKPMTDLDEAVGRLRLMHPQLPDDLGHALAAYATAPHPSGVGLTWRFDPRHQTQAPVAFRRDAYLEVLRCIEAKTLYVAGSKGMRLPDEMERLAAFKDVTSHEVANQGHMVHWYAADEIADVVGTFLAADG